MAVVAQDTEEADAEADILLVDLVEQPTMAVVTKGMPDQRACVGAGQLFSLKFAFITF